MSITLLEKLGSAARRDSARLHLPGPPLHRLDNRLRVQVADVAVGRSEARMPEDLLNAVNRYALVRQFKGACVP